MASAIYSEGMVIEEDGATPEPRTRATHSHTLVKALRHVPVSYTHLTLPTIYSV